MSTKHDDEPRKDAAFIQVDDDAKGAASAAPARRSRAIAALAAAACVALIVVSLGFVQPAAGGAWSLAWIVDSFQSGGVAGSTSGSSAQGSVASSSKASDGKSSSQKDGDKQGDSSKDAKDSKDSEDSKKEDGSSNSKEGGSSSKSGSEKNDAKSSSENSSQGDGSSSSNSGTAPGGTSSASGSGTSGGSSSSTGGSGGGSQDDGLITISVSVTSSAVGNPVSAGGTYTFKQGATVYDALCALGLSVNAHGSAYGTYVTAIGGLAEKEHGSSSGWMYSVNGSTPMVACSGYALSNGDNVVWYYVIG